MIAIYHLKKLSSNFFYFKDPLYATKCLKHSMELYQFAYKFKGVFSNVVPGHEQKYFSSNAAEDELVIFNFFKRFVFEKDHL